jgi:drug/metabolite transporter (DMT)-like permease
MSIGTVLQKKAVDTLPPMEQQTVGNNVKGVVTNKIWIVGWLLTTLAMLLNMIALGQADMTIIQPLIGFGLVILVIFSHYYLNEDVSKFEITGIVLAIIGVVILGATAEMSREFLSTEEVIKNYLQPNAWIILGIFIGAIAIMWIGTAKMQYKGAGIIFALIAATFSVTGLTFSKGAFTIIDIEGFFSSLGILATWVLLLCFISCSTMAIATQQMSLQKGKNVIVTPVFNLTSIILPLSTGYMVFGESIGIWKIIATIIILIGALFLSLKK